MNHNQIFIILLFYLTNIFIRKCEIMWWYKLAYKEELLQNMGKSVPVQPGKETLGCSNQIHNWGQKVIWQFSAGPPIIMATPSPSCYEVLKIFGRCIQLVRKGF